MQRMRFPPEATPEAGRRAGFAARTGSLRMTSEMRKAAMLRGAKGPFQTGRGSRTGMSAPPMNREWKIEEPFDVAQDSHMPVAKTGGKAQGPPLPKRKKAHRRKPFGFAQDMPVG